MLRPDNLLLAFAGTELRRQMDQVPLWRGDHVSIRQLVEDYARYLYLYRLKDPSVLLTAIRDGPGLLLWHQDSFAYADSYDEAAGRYRGLRSGQLLSLSEENLAGLLVKPDVARKQQEEETPITPGVTGPGGGAGTGTPAGARVDGAETEAAKAREPAPAPKRYHGSVALDATRVGRDASRIADEVISHLAGLVGSKVKVTLEIEAEIPSGAPDHVVRTVTENGRTLKFTSQGFEES
jgi:hypothetical protein